MQCENFDCRIGGRRREILNQREDLEKLIENLAEVDVCLKCTTCR